MAKQSAIVSLKESIRLLEIRQAEEGLALKIQFKETYESLKPANLIKSTFNDLTSSIEIKNSLFESILSILTGYLSSKIIAGSKSNPLMKILGALLQFGVTKLISNNAESVRIYIMNLIEKLIHPEEEEEEVIPEAE